MNQGKTGIKLPMVSAWKLKIFTAIVLLLGNIGYALQAGIIKWGGFDTSKQLADALADNSTLNTVAGAASICMLIGGLALPILVFLLVQGISETSNLGKYILSVGALAIISEIPYDMAYYGEVFHWGQQNPVFGMLLAMLMIYFMKLTESKGSITKVFLNALYMLGGILWAAFMKADSGILIILLAAIFYLCRKKHGIMMFAGILVTVLCSIVGIGSYIGALAFYGVYCYDEKERELKCSKYVFYAQYPVELLILGILVMVLV